MAFSPPDLLEQLGDRDAERELVHAGPLAVAGDAEQLVARGVLGADALEPLDALAEDAGHPGQGLDVVDHRRAVEEARDHRERRPVARLAAEALQRLDEGGLFAADVGAGAHGHHDVEVEALDAADVRGPAGLGLAAPLDDLDAGGAAGRRTQRAGR